MACCFSLLCQLILVLRPNTKFVCLLVLIPSTLTSKLELRVNTCYSGSCWRVVTVEYSAFLQLVGGWEYLYHHRRGLIFSFLQKLCCFWFASFIVLSDQRSRDCENCLSMVWKWRYWGSFVWVMRQTIAPLDSYCTWELLSNFLPPYPYCLFNGSPNCDWLNLWQLASCGWS